jgi:hypothetical protein
MIQVSDRMADVCGASGNKGVDSLTRTRRRSPRPQASPSRRSRMYCSLYIIVEIGVFCLKDWLLVRCTLVLSTIALHCFL